MGQTRRYKILNQENFYPFSAPYPGYRLYKAKEDSYSATEFYILSREPMINGFLFNADDGDEFLEPKPEVGQTHNIRKLRVYRPVTTLERFFRVKDEILSKHHHSGFSSQGIDPYTHHVTLSVRPPKPHTGYQEEGRLSYIFSTVNYHKGEEIPSSELQRLVPPHDRRDFDFYLHDDKAYRKRVWDAVMKCG